MRKSRFSEEQIIGVLREQEAGVPTVPFQLQKYETIDQPERLNTEVPWVFSCRHSPTDRPAEIPFRSGELIGVPDFLEGRAAHEPPF